MEPNSGTRAIVPPGDHELMAVDSWLKTGGDDGNGERDHADTEKHHHPAEHLAQRRYRHDITIVASAHQAACGIEPTLSGCIWRSVRYMPDDANSSNIRMTRSPPSSARYSSATTRPSVCSAGE